MHGTLWHDWFHSILVKAQVPFMFEVKLDDVMPEGWSGTADWVFYNPNRNAYVLGDLKTAKGEALYWINSKGAKEEHIWQLSAYWHALVKQGWPMIKGFGIMYWPMNDAGGNTPIEPIVQDCNPLPEDIVIGRMEERWALCKAYLHEVEKTGELVNPALADEIEREQRISYDKNRGIFNVSLYPHWSTAFCPYDPPYCACREQSVTKIGHYSLEGEYSPRKGYEVIAPLVRPSQSDFIRKGKEHGSTVSERSAEKVE